jgi:hypothetical protein
VLELDLHYYLDGFCTPPRSGAVPYELPQSTRQYIQRYHPAHPSDHAVRDV